MFELCMSVAIIIPRVEELEHFILNVVYEKHKKLYTNVYFKCCTIPNNNVEYFIVVIDVFLFCNLADDTYTLTSLESYNESFQA